MGPFESYSDSTASEASELAVLLPLRLLHGALPRRRRLAPVPPPPLLPAAPEGGERGVTDKGEAGAGCLEDLDFVGFVFRLVFDAAAAVAAAAAAAAAKAGAWHRSSACDFFDFSAK
jgi:hypothetical protein